MKGCSALLFILLIFAQQGIAQKEARHLHLRSGKIVVLENNLFNGIDTINKRIAAEKASFILIQFDGIPSEQKKQELLAEGIQLINYVPDYAYAATIKKIIRKDVLQKAGAKGICQLAPQQKMDASLASGKYPSYAVKVTGTVDVMATITKSFAIEEALKVVSDAKIEVVSKDWLHYRVLKTRVTAQQLFFLADQPFIEFVSPALPADEPLNHNSRILSHANVLNASISSGGKGLNGEGIVVGIGDNADIQSNTDFSGRLINRTSASPDGHGTHVSGIAAGGGIVNELHKGYMPKATIISQYFNGILIQAPTYVKDFGMVVTNNAYGALVGCENNGIYDQTSAILDQQLLDLPYLQHVFAAGNSGALTCGAYPPGFKTVLGVYQSAKNVLTVGNTTLDGEIAVPSSRGPVRDGRLKPEVTAMGTAVSSTWPFNTYASIGGTSMSAPAVAGGAGLLYQRYRQLNGNTNPKGALIKALICNGATDKGNPGPDFKYGFGSMNLLRSVDMLEKNRVFSNTVTAGSTAMHHISVPANTASLKIMLYWHDPAASALTTKALVHDLDLEVIDPSASTVLPLVLDSTALHVNDIAVNGADHTNNIEQVVINNPASGAYTIRIKGTAITQNPSQEYFVVYDVIPNSIQLTSPPGGDAWQPGETLRISWDAYGSEASTFSLEYSTDGGTNWNPIASGITAGTQFYSWVVPSLVTENALIRVTKDATGQSAISNLFTIIGVPSVSLSPVQCEGYFSVNWASVSGATDYEVMMFRGNEMKTISTTTATSFVINSLSSDSTYWVSVRARVNGKWGRRSVAVSRQPNMGNCSGSISDNDLKLNAVLSPVSGRKYTSTELSSATPVSIEIKNLDDAPATNFTVAYSTDGGANWITENVFATLAAGAVYTHNFASTANLSAIGSHNILAAVTNSALDAITANDTMKLVVKHLDNQPLNLTSIVTDNIEAAADSAYAAKTIGITGLERYDFENTTGIGRLRTSVNSGVSNSGNKSLTMDVSAKSNTHNVNYVYGTFNLANYGVNSNEIRFDLQFNVHGLNRTDSNKLWIRGDDTKPWIQVYDFVANKNGTADYKRTQSIELADSLAKYGQEFSSSFQFRWGQNGSYATVDRDGAGGVSVDDIRLYEAVNDAQVVSIDMPSYYSCGLNNAFSVKLTVRNGVRSNLNNVPVKYSINDGPWVTETIPSLAPESSMQYSFVTPADLSMSREYVIKAIVDNPGDNIHDNDTATITIYNVPMVASFPYLQNFENGNGGWFAAGANSSWAYGTPASIKINGAASGSKAWKTRLAGNHNDLELSYLNSPCFDLTGISNPTLSFNVALDLEDCGTSLCDAAWVEYSSDGINWTKLVDTTSAATNWYNAPGHGFWSIENNTRWHVVTASLPKGLNQMRLRIVLSSDPAVNREGIAVDDIHVYDNIYGIYAGASTSASANAVITGGNSWIHFQKDGSLVASLQPNNQVLGSTDVDVYVNSGPVRYTVTQYYGDRSITIKPANTSLTDSVTVRFYFLDSEAEALINASGCSSCTKPIAVSGFGVSQYDDYDLSFENGNVGDNNQGIWTFHPAAIAAKVPFDKGYYVEFKVKAFSEFWLSNGGINGSTVLPIKLLHFDAKKGDRDDVIIAWTVAGESNVSRYEIEVARSSEDLQHNRFEKIGEIESAGNSIQQKNFSFVDKEPLKTGVRYYRIKVINMDGSYSFTAMKSVVFNNAIEWSIQPNPSSGKFHFVYHLNSGETINMQLTDATGRLVKNYAIVGDGLINKKTIDISETSYASGIYFLHIYKAGKKKSFKLYKQ